MKTVKLRLEFRYDTYWEWEEVEAEKEVFDYFLDSFSKAFAKETSWYRFGSMSGKIIIEDDITAGEFIEFIYEVDGLKELEKSIMELNPQFAQHGINTFSRMTLFSLDRYLFNHYRDTIDKAILKENKLKELPKGLGMELETYQYEGEEVVFFDFYQACYGESDIYAVPVKVAEELCLGDYDGEEISRDSDFLHEISEYKITDEIIIKASSIKAYNYD